MTLTELYAIYKEHPIICTDTRKITQGCLFFALKGPNYNANKFADEALNKGASFCIIDDAEYATNAKFILVDDALLALQQLANHHRKQLNIPVIAIVGSNGKTTTKELITAVLSTTFIVWATPGNFNNHIGLPLTLLQLTHQHQVAIIEMGANHVGENADLCAIAEPTLGIVTNNGMDHLEGFGDIEGVAKSNSELYYYLLKNSGTAFVNAHDEWLMRMSSRLKKCKTYAANTNLRNVTADYIGFANQLQPSISYKYEELLGTSVLSGDYNFDNIMAAIAIAKYLGVNNQNIVKGIESYQPTNNRSQWIKKEHNVIFMDAYNANPSSMEVALRNFAAMEHPHKVVIMGDMFEMGNYAKAEHQRMVDLCEGLKLNNVILVGEEFVNLNPNNKLAFKTTQQASEFIKQQFYKNCAFFIKGSRGMKLETLSDVIE
ncbi:MAG: UDP-N-acetylmuramoyl-tripeptide--D-alanyl-D-alanine ligase [Bacteroidia bacterium]|nr:UDP-N-acetylmuramoyl-tripeptide--D-alanyl-D-alanine ligase [Bacteroidia bacterium]MBP9689330.1 UDP-N-acetylmuramoyl-tripeptide--D-alanyl-D-alanine ligase [Bacteroidia bacterium]